MQPVLFGLRGVHPLEVHSWSSLIQLDDRAGLPPVSLGNSPRLERILPQGELARGVLEFVTQRIPIKVRKGGRAGTVKHKLKFLRHIRLGTDCSML